MKPKYKLALMDMADENSSESSKTKDARTNIIKTFFNYDPKTGVITWENSVSPSWYKRQGDYDIFLRNRAGKQVKFYEHSGGYLYTSVLDYTSILAHHIVWVHVYGRLPTGQLDHIDGDRKNNSFENLREVTSAINGRNQKMRSTNTSGVTGVSWNKENKNWRARIMFNGKTINLGSYDTIESAAKAREDFMLNNQQMGFTSRHGKRS